MLRPFTIERFAGPMFALAGTLAANFLRTE